MTALVCVLVFWELDVYIVHIYVYDVCFSSSSRQTDWENEKLAAHPMK